MAIWQFQVYFIPRLPIFDKYGHLPLRLELNKERWNDYLENGDLNNAPEFEDALTIDWWRNLDLDISDLLPILYQFSELQHWTAKTDGLRGFGSDETNDISVCFDEETGKVQDLSCRLDLRQIDKGFINKALALATQFACMLMDKRGNLYEPTVANLIGAIQTSNGNRFINNPEEFLDDLSNRKLSPE